VLPPTSPSPVPAFVAVATTAEQAKGGGFIVVILRRPFEGGFLMPPALRVEHHDSGFSAIC
jgi:hypothetical protein